MSFHADYITHHKQLIRAVITSVWMGVLSCRAEAGMADDSLQARCDMNWNRACLLTGQQVKQEDNEYKHSRHPQWYVDCNLIHFNYGSLVINQ